MNNKDTSFDFIEQNIQFDKNHLDKRQYLQNFSFEDIKNTNFLYDNPVQQKKILPPNNTNPNKPKQTNSLIDFVKEDNIVEDNIKEEINNNIISDNGNIDNFSNVENLESAKIMTKKLEYKPNFRIDRIPVYPTVSKKLGQEGTISLIISLDNRGEVLSIDINKSTGYKLLDDSAIKTVKEWNYKQLIDGYTLNYLVTTNIVFKLE